MQEPNERGAGVGVRVWGRHLRLLLHLPLPHVLRLPPGRRSAHRHCLQTTGGVLCQSQGVTRRCRLSLLTNSALIYRVPMRGGGGGLKGLSQ